MQNSRVKFRLVGRRPQGAGAQDALPHWRPALALDGASFPRSCEILPGNASEPGTLEDALTRLKAVCGGAAPKPTLIMDAGIAIEENIVWLGEERGYDWIAVGRDGKSPPPEGGPKALLITSEVGEARLHVVSESKK